MLKPEQWILYVVVTIFVFTYLKYKKAVSVCRFIVYCGEGLISSQMVSNFPGLPSVNPG